MWSGLALVLAVAGVQLPGSASKPDFSGAWRLDRTISVDPAKINLGPGGAGERSQSGNRRGKYGGFGGGGSGSGGFGRGGYGGGSSRNQSGAGALTSEEQSRLNVLTDELRNAMSSIVISHHDPNFVVTDTRDHAQFFQTDGSSTENHLANATLPSSTRWDGSHVVTECPVASRLTLVYSYTLLAASNQLVLRVNRQDGAGLRAFDPDVKLVYTRAVNP